MTRDKRVADYIERYLNKKTEGDRNISFTRNDDCSFDILNDVKIGPFSFTIKYPHISCGGKGNLPRGCKNTDKMYAKAWVKTVFYTIHLKNGWANRITDEEKNKLVSKYFSKELAKAVCRADEEVDVKLWAEKLSLMYHVKIKESKINKYVEKIKEKEEVKDYE